MSGLDSLASAIMLEAVRQQAMAMAFYQIERAEQLSEEETLAFLGGFDIVCAYWLGSDGLLRGRAIKRPSVGVVMEGQKLMGWPCDGEADALRLEELLNPKPNLTLVK